MSKPNERAGIRGWLKDGVSRRRFIELSSVAAAGAAVLTRVPLAHAAPGPSPDPLGGTLERTACMMCNAGCGMQVRVKDGVALHIEGNAYDPQARDYAAGSNVDGSGYVTEAAVPDAAQNGGALCSRGAAALATLYDPLRLKTPLKRSGPRGAGQWEAISWQQAIREICWGGILPDGAFQGLAAIRDVTNRFTASDTAYSADAPLGVVGDYGFKANQLLMSVGRDQVGDATSRFMNAFGSINRIDHTSLCNSSYKLAGYLHFCKESSATGTYNFKPDIDAADTLVFFGTNPVEANAPTNTFIRKLAAFKKRGGQLVVIDPAFTNTAAKADKWIGSIKVGTDLALALAICRGIIDKPGFSLDHLRRSHAPGTGASYKSWTDAPYLVNQTTHRFVSTAEAGLTTFVGRLRTALTTGAITTLDLEDLDGGTGTLDLTTWPSRGQVRIGTELFFYTGKVNTAGARQLTGVSRAMKWTSAAAAAQGALVSLAYVCSAGGTLKAYHDTTGGTVLPDLEHTRTVGTDTWTSVFKMFKDSLDTIANYSALCGVSTADIDDLVTRLTDGTRKVCVDLYRGALSHTNGTHAVRAIYMINVLLDRIDRKGGYALGKRLKAGVPALPGAPTRTGVPIDRSKKKHEPVVTTQTPVRPWYPLGYFGVQQELWPSLKIGYPYPIKALITYTSNPAFSTPFNHQAIDTLLDRRAVPLHVAVDIFMSETTALADYVLPDSTFLERWGGGLSTGYATNHITGSVLRRPVVGTIDPSSHAYTPVLPNTRTMDDILIALALELGLPGYGKDGMGTGKDLYQAWDFWNEAYKGSDLAMPTGLADLTQPILKMGGKFKDPAILYDTAMPDFVTADAVYGGLISIYSEKVATTKHSYTKAYFSGIPVWEQPHKNWKDVVVNDATASMNLKLVNYKKVHHTQSRSTSNAWLREISPENAVSMHPTDATARSLNDGDMVRIRSVRYTVTGRLRVTESAQPGTVVVPYHYGRWEFGSRPYRVDGVAVKSDPAVARGIPVNPLVAPDPELKDVCFTDPLGGSAEFYSTNVAVEKA